MDGLTLPPSPIQALQAEHERLLGRLDDIGGAPCSGTTPVPIDQLSFETQALVHEARAYIERSKAEAEWVHDARDRSQLRANLRFWSSFLVNCTGIYPDTTLRPARPFAADYPGLPKMPPASSGSGGASGKPQSSGGTAGGQEPVGSGAEDELNASEAPEDAAVLDQERPSWFARLSHTFGLFAILIVGVIPLAAVCLALSLFYNLDNRSPWASAGESATQTATAAQQLPSPTPLLLETEPATSTLSPGIPDPAKDLPYLKANVSTGESALENASCTPILSLSFEAPGAIDGKPIPAIEIAIYPAGTETSVAGGTLVPGAAPLKLSLESTASSPIEQAWLVQADHPWLGVEAVILSGALFKDCAQDQVSILYKSQPGFEIWQQASEAGSPSVLDLGWKLLTWGPEALSENSWVASLSLQASGGNGTYVYFAAGDLASPAAGSGLLPDGRLVLEQALCVSALVQVGVTSAGQSYNQALPMQLVIPECR